MYRRPAHLLVSGMLAGVLAAAVLSPAMAQQVSGSVVSELEVRALVSPVNRIAYRSLLSAPVKAAPVLAGEKFAKGDLLLAFDCERTHAEPVVHRLGPFDRSSHLGEIRRESAAPDR